MAVFWLYSYISAQTCIKSLLNAKHCFRYRENKYEPYKDPALRIYRIYVPGSRVQSNNKTAKLMNKIILHSDELFEKIKHSD